MESITYTSVFLRQCGRFGSLPFQAKGYQYAELQALLVFLPYWWLIFNQSQYFLNYVLGFLFLLLTRYLSSLWPLSFFTRVSCCYLMQWKNWLQCNQRSYEYQIFSSWRILFFYTFLLTFYLFPSPFVSLQVLDWFIFPNLLFPGSLSFTSTILLPLYSLQFYLVIFNSLPQVPRAAGSPRLEGNSSTRSSQRSWKSSLEYPYVDTTNKSSY